MFSRRDFGKLMGAGIAARGAFAGKLDSTINGVRLGVQTYSYRELPMSTIIDSVIQAMTANGLSECELFAQQVEPPNPATNFWVGTDPATLGSGADGGPLQEKLRAKAKSEQVMKARAELRKWRLTTPLEHFHKVRKKFEDAGIRVHVYNLSFNDSFTDEEIDRGFEHAKALGVGIISASTTLTVAKRVARFAEKHRMYVAVHNHANLKDPNEFATVESFQTALAMSKFFRINLDIGHFTAANYDAVKFIEQHHADITNLHLKDRKRNGGENMEWGHGDTPIRQVLALLKEKKYPIPAYIEYEYPGKGTCVEEVKKCFDYAKKALA